MPSGGASGSAPQRRARLRGFFLDARSLLVVIVLNAVVLFIAAFPQLSLVPTRWLTGVEDLITLVFVVEAVVEVRHVGGPG